MAAEERTKPFSVLQLGEYLEAKESQINVSLK
jgi:hypothetical protein